MKILICLILNFGAITVFSQSFKQKQLNFERVKDAFEIKWPELEDLIKSKDFNPKKFRIFIRVFKEEQKQKFG